MARQKRDDPTPTRDLEGYPTTAKKWSAAEIRAHRKSRIMSSRPDPDYDHDNSGDLLKEMDQSLDEHYTDLESWGVEFDK